MEDHVSSTDSFGNGLLNGPSRSDILNLLILLFEALEVVELLFVKDFLQKNIVRCSCEDVLNSIVLNQVDSNAQYFHYQCDKIYKFIIECY